MLSRKEFIQQSLDFNLFFIRIMKEHALFLALGFTPKNSMLIQRAREFQLEYERLLLEYVTAANGLVSEKVLTSGQLVTPFTFEAEKVTEYYTGIKIDTKITRAELAMQTDKYTPDTIPMALEQHIFALNQKAIFLTGEFIRFKEKVLAEVLACRVFTTNYPKLLEHVVEEAAWYIKGLRKLQMGQGSHGQEILKQEVFWNEIMGEHAQFIRGLLDPSEEELIHTANHFAKEFEGLKKEAEKALDKLSNIGKVTEKSMKATKQIRDFKAKGTEGLIQCKIKSIILPLLSDHTLREANHYLSLLKSY
ncbi:MAG: DUF2935 domain-containing protein [Bacillota bacterium]